MTKSKDNRVYEQLADALDTLPNGFPKSSLRHWISLIGNSRGCKTASDDSVSLL
jgi:hypothetical protein